MCRNKRQRELIPPWNMPSDPVKAVFWFMHWLLKVLVHFFWIPIIVMVIYETYLSWKVDGIGNGLIAGFVTLLVGICVWTVLYVVLLLLNVSTSVSQIISDVSRMQQQGTLYSRPPNPSTDAEPESKVVEGTITDLEEERKRRRSE